MEIGSLPTIGYQWQIYLWNTSIIVNQTFIYFSIVSNYYTKLLYTVNTYKEYLFYCFYL